ncbi:MAG: hypothetical protein V3T30_00315 [Thermodesulfobacteriota bacterium]
MPGKKVCIDNVEKPTMHKGPAIDPKYCAIFRWVVEFFMTTKGGKNPPKSKGAGFIVQRVDVSKMVFNCDGTPDKKQSDSRTVWETFKIGKDGLSEGTDTWISHFPKGRRTTVSITGSASFHRKITGATRKAVKPNTKGGADGILDKQPNGFAPTLIRTMHLYVDCCSQTGTVYYKVVAYSTGRKYEETWKLEPGQKRPSHMKKIDGKKVAEKKKDKKIPIKEPIKKPKKKLKKKPKKKLD